MLNWVARIAGKNPSHASFRELVWELFRRKLFRKSKTVAKEIREHSPRLNTEIGKRDVDIITPSKELAAKAKALREEFMKQGRIVGKKCVNANDLLFILIADELGMTVATDEAPSKGNFNIPAACRHLDVPCLSSAALLAKCGF